MTCLGRIDIFTTPFSVQYDNATRQYGKSIWFWELEPCGKSYAEGEISRAGVANESGCLFRIIPDKFPHMFHSYVTVRPSQ